MLPRPWSSQDHAREEGWFYSFLNYVYSKLVNVFFVVFVSLFFILWAFFIFFNQVQPTSLVTASWIFRMGVKSVSVKGCY